MKVPPSLEGLGSAHSELLRLQKVTLTFKERLIATLMCTGAVLNLQRNLCMQPKQQYGLPYQQEVTVTKERYSVVLEDFWKELESIYPFILPALWFQQDGASGASAHYSNVYKEWLQNHFGKRVVSLKTDFEWFLISRMLIGPPFPRC